MGLLTYEWDESRTQALRAGARGCLTKDQLNQDLVSLVRDCAALRRLKAAPWDVVIAASSLRHETGRWAVAPALSLPGRD